MAVLNQYKFYNINPKDCLDLSFEQSFSMLKELLGESTLNNALDISSSYPSPLADCKDTQWCKTIKIIGINPRLTKTFWGIVKYAMTFPESGIHLMPLWTTGDKGSLYVQTSWRLNEEFLDTDLARSGYDTAEKQLKLVINILHALGKIVGFDALPHVDNFSEITLLNPGFFEWAKLNKQKNSQLFYPDVDYNFIYKEVENIIISTLNAPDNLFELQENERESIIFPQNTDRTAVRIKLMKKIRAAGLEPLPVTEHSPMRPVVFQKIKKSGSNSWAVFDVKNRSNAAKVIGCITPYKWYKIDTQGYPVKNAPEDDVWSYYSGKIADFQNEYNFDFLRADMAHNQISHSHISNEKDENEKQEMWAYLKNKISSQKPYFALLAEAFYNTYYINGISDMINKKADIVLGNMNFKYLNNEFIDTIDDFLKPFRENFPFYPCICTFSNDGDLKEHSKYFQSEEANEVRFFISMFLNLPSYTGMGYETKSLKPQKSNEFSNEYVKHQSKPYQWGKNAVLYGQITKMRELYVKYKSIIDNCRLDLINSENNALVWCYYSDNEPKLLFAVNLNPNKHDIKIKLPCNVEYATLSYTNSKYDEICIDLNSYNIDIENIYIGECLILELDKALVI